jgi:dihydrofolate reductase
LKLNTPAAGRKNWKNKMRKIIFFMLTSLDGYFEGPEGDINWHNVDEEFNEFAIEQLNTVGTLLFGRVTYELMASYWPTPAATTDDPNVAGKMNSLPKIVFSRTLDKVEWNNTRLVKNNFVEEISKLKQQPGKDLIIFGSSDLAVSFIPHGLIDEFRIMINPVILGGGKTLFKGLLHKLDLKLIKTKIFKSGNVLLYYAKNNRNNSSSAAQALPDSA